MCLLTDRDEMRNFNRRPSIDASYQVSVHLAQWFQRRRLKYEKLTDDGQQTQNDDKSSHCLSQGELKILIPMKITLNRLDNNSALCTPTPFEGTFIFMTSQ